MVAEAVGALYAAEFCSDLGTRKIIIASVQCSELHWGGIEADLDTGHARDEKL